MTQPIVELNRARIEYLFSRLDQRLRARGVAGAVYVVGGVAIALTVVDSRRTVDVDVLVSPPSVLDEARRLALEEGLPPTWLNESARPYVPPRPPEATVPPTEPGLRVDVAPLEHLLAMKLVALRQRDVPDILALVDRLRLRGAPAEAFVQILLDAYRDSAALAVALGVTDEAVVEEAQSIGRWTVNELERTTPRDTERR